MALDSNAQRDNNGIPLPHITPVPTPQAMGVNLFTQDIAWVKGSVFESFPPNSAYWSCFEIPSGTEGAVHYCGTGQVPSALLVAYPPVRVFASTASGHAR